MVEHAQRVATTMRSRSAALRRGARAGEIGERARASPALCRGFRQPLEERVDERCRAGALRARRAVAGPRDPVGGAERARRAERRRRFGLVGRGKRQPGRQRRWRQPRDGRLRERAAGGRCRRARPRPARRAPPAISSPPTFAVEAAPHHLAPGLSGVLAWPCGTARSRAGPWPASSRRRGGGCAPPGPCWRSASRAAAIGGGSYVLPGDQTGKRPPCPAATGISGGSRPSTSQPSIRMTIGRFEALRAMHGHDPHLVAARHRGRA